MTQKQLPAPELDEIYELTERIRKSENPDPLEIDRVRKLAVKIPRESFPDVMNPSLRNRIIGKVFPPAAQGLAHAKIEKQKQDLGYDTSPVSEQLLIDHILTLQLRLHHAEATYMEAALDKKAAPAMVLYRDKLAASIQTRYLKAIETLARVRRLTGNTPPLQINIAQEGGQQFNMQGGG